MDRVHKKFCIAYFRNGYDNKQKIGSNNNIRNINNVSGNDPRLWESILPEGEKIARASKEKLLLVGFVFKHITHIYTTKTGKTYFFCYEYGYLPLENNWCLIVKRKEK